MAVVAKLDMLVPRFREPGEYCDLEGPTRRMKSPNEELLNNSVNYCCLSAAMRRSHCGHGHSGGSRVEAFDRCDFSTIPLFSSILHLLVVCSGIHI